MASIRFAGLVLGVIIISLALKYSSACAQEGVNRKGKWLPSIATQHHASSQTDLHNDSAAAVMAKVAGRKVLGGRNKWKGEILKRKNEKKEGSNKRPEISGKDAPKKFSEGAEQYHSNNEDKIQASQHSENEVAQKAYANMNPGYSPNSERSDYSSGKDDNSKEFLEAAEEVANLMQKDYRGMNRPRQKPPINNYEPRD